MKQADDILLRHARRPNKLNEAASEMFRGNASHAANFIGDPVCAAKMNRPASSLCMNLKTVNPFFCRRGHMITITSLIKKRKADPDKIVFRLRFDANSPVPELVLSPLGLMGNLLIRGENFGGRNQALTMLCGDAAAAGYGVIYITEGLISSLVASLREKVNAAFGPTRYHALNVAIEKDGKLKVSRKAVSMLQFNSYHSQSSVEEIRRRLPGILDWIEESNFEQPLLMILENYHLYCKEFAADLLSRANMANCAVVLTTIGSDPRVGLVPEIEPGVFEKCSTILDLNRRRANTETPG